MIPVSIPTPGGACFAAYDWAPGRAVLIVPPFGMEAEASARIWRDFAVRLAAEGIAVLRPDLPGTGDSAGAATDPDRVAAWRAAIVALHGWLAARHAGRVALLGCRFGALLALDALARGVAADGLVLLDPPVSGALLARGLRARARLEGLGQPPEGADFIQAYGVPIATATLSELSVLPAPFAPGRRLPPVHAVLTAQPSPWPERLRALGAAVSEAAFAGHGDFVLQGPMHAIAPRAVFDGVAAFLHALPDAVAAPPPLASAGLAMPGLTELPMAFGTGLFGILCRPETPLRGAPWVVLPSTGNRPRSGLDGSWTVLARRLAQGGIASLRFDAGGVGDSLGETPALPGAAAYMPARIAELRCAIDLVSGLGAPEVVLVGHCSGGYVAWQGAIEDDRVAGLLTINALVLGRQTPAGALSLSRPAPSAAVAPVPAARPGARRWLRRVVPAALWDFARVLGPDERQARRGLRILAARRCVVRFVYADAPGEDYRFRRAFGPRPRLPPGIGVTIIRGADHELSARRHRAACFDLVADFARSLAQPAESQAASRPSRQEIAA